ncbi:unnamed protein product [Closterium sp. NIES-64]|nr:unnamed protein product [Closterium sp. NIES-64]
MQEGSDRRSSGTAHDGGAMRGEEGDEWVWAEHGSDGIEGGGNWADIWALIDGSGGVTGRMVKAASELGTAAAAAVAGRFSSFSGSRDSLVSAAAEQVPSNFSGIDAMERVVSWTDLIASFTAVRPEGASPTVGTNEQAHLNELSAEDQTPEACAGPNDRPDIAAGMPTEVAEEQQCDEFGWLANGVCRTDVATGVAAAAAEETVAEAQGTNAGAGDRRTVTLSPTPQPEPCCGQQGTTTGGAGARTNGAMSHSTSAAPLSTPSSSPLPDLASSATTGGTTTPSSWPGVGAWGSAEERTSELGGGADGGRESGMVGRGVEESGAEMGTRAAAEGERVVGGRGSAGLGGADGLAMGETEGAVRARGRKGGGASSWECRRAECGSRGGGGAQGDGADLMELAPRVGSGGDGGGSGGGSNKGLCEARDGEVIHAAQRDVTDARELVLQTRTAGTASSAEGQGKGEEGAGEVEEAGRGAGSGGDVDVDCLEMVCAMLGARKRLKATPVGVIDGSCAAGERMGAHAAMVDGMADAPFLPGPVFASPLSHHSRFPPHLAHSLPHATPPPSLQLPPLHHSSAALPVSRSSSRPCSSPSAPHVSGLAGTVSASFPTTGTPTAASLSPHSLPHHFLAPHVRSLHSPAPPPHTPAASRIGSADAGWGDGGVREQAALVPKKRSLSWAGGDVSGAWGMESAAGMAHMANIAHEPLTPVLPNGSTHSASPALAAAPPALAARARERPFAVDAAAVGIKTAVSAASGGAGGISSVRRCEEASGDGDGSSRAVPLWSQGLQRIAWLQLQHRLLLMKQRQIVQQGQGQEVQGDSADEAKREEHLEVTRQIKQVWMEQQQQQQQQQQHAAGVRAQVIGNAGALGLATMSAAIPQAFTPSAAQASQSAHQVGRSGDWESQSLGDSTGLRQTIPHHSTSIAQLPFAAAVRRAILNAAQVRTPHAERGRAVGMQHSAAPVTSLAGTAAAGGTHVVASAAGMDAASSGLARHGESPVHVPRFPPKPLCVVSPRFPTSSSQSPLLSPLSCTPRGRPRSTGWGRSGGEGKGKAGRQGRWEMEWTGGSPGEAVTQQGKAAGAAKQEGMQGGAEGEGERGRAWRGAMWEQRDDSMGSAVSGGGGGGMVVVSEGREAAWRERLSSGEGAVGTVASPGHMVCASAAALLSRQSSWGCSDARMGATAGASSSSLKEAPLLPRSTSAAAASLTVASPSGRALPRVRSLAAGGRAAEAVRTAEVAGRWGAGGRGESGGGLVPWGKSKSWGGAGRSRAWGAGEGGCHLQGRVAEAKVSPGEVRRGESAAGVASASQSSLPAAASSIESCGLLAQHIRRQQQRQQEQQQQRLQEHQLQRRQQEQVMGDMQGKRCMEGEVHVPGKYRALGDLERCGSGMEDKGQSSEKSILEVQLDELMSETHSNTAPTNSISHATAPAPHLLSSAAIALLLSNALTPLPLPAAAPASQSSMLGATVPAAQGGRP